VADLLDHQCEALDFLAKNRSGLVALEQGLGKTLVAIEGFRRLRETGELDRMLVVCPNSLKRNWAAELDKFVPDLEWAIVEGTRAHRRGQFASISVPVVITSYETARTEIAAIIALIGRGRTVLVLDESHATKNRLSLTSTAASHFAPRCARRWLLSGTPVTNSPSDLHTQIGIIEPGANPLGSEDSFLSDLESKRPDVREDAIARAQEYVFRRTKQECLDLPEKIFSDRRIELPAWQRRLYDDMRDQLVCEIEAMDGSQYRAFASTALVRLARLSQIASNPALLIPTEGKTPGKWLELDDLIGEIVAEPKGKVILWSNYVKSIEALLDRYQDIGSVALYGGTLAQDRQALATRFQEDPDTKVMVANPAAAGTGFTMTSASFTIYESLSWRYDFYAQSQDRNHRIGQTLPVTYVRLIAADTIEEAIVGALERKAGMARDLLGDEAPTARVSELTPGEMRTLLLENRLPGDS